MIGFFDLLVQPHVQDYLIAHEKDDERELVLKHKEIHHIPASVIAAQLSGRRKAKIKIPLWYQTRAIVYPPSLNLEQTSSQATGTFKAEFIKSILKNRTIAVDLTGGFGVDTFFLSTIFKEVHYVEPDKTVLAIASHNHAILCAPHILHHHKTAENFIDQQNDKVDLIYIDPSRRDSKSRKVFKLSDCVPDVCAMQEAIYSKTKFLLIKTSPLLDIQQGLRELKGVSHVIVVSVEDEVKELLFFCHSDFNDVPQLKAVDLLSDGSVRTSFSFYLDEEKKAHPLFSEPLEYLYEPNASIMKAGAFKLVADKFDVSKLSVNTHLYTSMTFIPDFPGRIFRVHALNPDKKNLTALLPEGKANVAIRNYSITAEELKKKLSLRDGGDKYVLGFSSERRKHIAVCERVLK